ncbi:MAG: hypothetical protein R2827_03700 [Bdellovibrionales bacterium]
MKQNSLISVLAISAILVLFQNCDQQKFSFEKVEVPSTASGVDSSPDEEGAVSDEDLTELPPEDPVEQPPIIGDGTPEIPDIGDQPNYDPGEEVYVPPITFAGCNSFIEIPPDMTTIPAYDGQGICYYKKLMSAISNHKSGTHGEERTTGVVSDNHDEGPAVIAPFEIADISFNFSLAGPRKVAFSSKYDNPVAEMKIDNYFLIELAGPQNSAVWAYGTADAEPNGGQILLNGEPVENFYSFAPGGTATVTAIDVTSSVPAGVELSMRFRALDCGGSAAGSDVFLVFY